MAHRPPPAERGLRLAVAILGLWLSGCERAPAAESLNEWGPGDHHSTDDDKLNSRAQAPANPSAGRNGGDVAQLVDLTWRQQCSTCHGMQGKGDGQMGPMVHAPDLTRGDWQATVTNADLVGVIRAGRNKMPKFDLPAPVLDGLVARIRSLRVQ